MGCGCSKRKITTVEKSITPQRDPTPSPPPPRNPTPSPPSPRNPTPILNPSPSPPPSPLPPPPEIDIVEDFVIVWLDPSLDENSDKTKEIKEQLQEIVNVVVIFTDPRKCRAFINRIKDEKIFLIVTQKLVKTFVPTVQDLPQIDSIYSFDLEEQIHESQIDETSQLCRSYKSIDDLCQKIKMDVKICDHDLVTYGFVGGSSSTTVIDINQHTTNDHFSGSSSPTIELEENQNMVGNQLTSVSKTTVENNQNVANDVFTVESFSKSTTDEESAKETSSKVLTKNDHEFAGQSSLISEAKDNRSSGEKKPSPSNSQKYNNVQILQGLSSKTGTESHQNSSESKPTKTLLSTIETSDKKQFNNELFSNIEIGNHSEAVSSMYDSLLKEILLALDEDDIEDIYNFCSDACKDNPKQLKLIQPFKKTYKSDQAIRWYTKDTCLYRVLNKSLRLRQYNQLYFLRVFIRHLHEDIDRRKTQTKNIRLYRGQGLAREDFERNPPKKGKLMFVSNFWSTSTNRGIALEFATPALGDETQVSVLMEINVDKNISVPLADIREYSAYQREEEWLFSFGSVFRIDEVKRLRINEVEGLRTDGVKVVHDEIWQINLTTTNDDNEERAKLKKYFKNFIEDKNACLSFARLLFQLGNWEQSRDFYMKGLEKETEWFRKAGVFNNLGRIASELGKNDEALQHYNESLRLEIEENDPNYKDLAATYNNIGTLYYKVKQIDEALLNFQLAIEAYNGMPNGNQEIESTIYNNYATVLNYQGKYREALEYNEKCLNIRVAIFPPLHPSLATSYNSIASTYHYLRSLAQAEGNGQKAIEYAQQAVNYAEEAVRTDLQALPPDHPQTKIHVDNLVCFKNALIALTA